MLKVGFLANSYLNPDEVRSWSGLPYHFARNLRAAGCEVVPVRAQKEPPAFGRKVRQALWQYGRGRRYLRDLEPGAMRAAACGWEARLRELGDDVDVVFSASSWPLAELETDRPTVFWTDATFAAMCGFYASFSRLAPVSLARGLAVERTALARCALAVYASDWAARSAVADHGADPAKVRVLDFGANLEPTPTRAEGETAVGDRGASGDGVCELLFIGVDWERKGADVAVATVGELRHLGVPARLRIAGCQPPAGFRLPDDGSVEVLGFLDKNSPEGRAKLAALYRESHFFILPSRAEAYGVVFCEACAYGVPCLAAAVGGIPSIIRDGENGRLFPAAATGADYARSVAEVWREPARYRALARGALDAFHARLDGARSAARLAELMAGLATRRPSTAPDPALVAA